MSKKYKSYGLDFIYGIALLVTFLFLFSTTQGQESQLFVLKGDAPPFFVAQIYLILLSGLSLCLIIFSFLSSKAAPEWQMDWTRFILTVLAVAAATAVYNWLGFVFSMIPTVILVGWILGFRKVWILSCVSTVSVLTIWVILVKIARMPLPVSPWSHSI